MQSEEEYQIDDGDDGEEEEDVQPVVAVASTSKGNGAKTKGKRARSVSVDDDGRPPFVTVLPVGLTGLEEQTRLWLRLRKWSRSSAKVPLLQ